MLSISSETNLIHTPLYSIDIEESVNAGRTSLAMISPKSPLAMFQCRYLNNYAHFIIFDQLQNCRIQCSIN